MRAADLGLGRCEALADGRKHVETMYRQTEVCDCMEPGSAPPHLRPRHTFEVVASDVRLISFAPSRACVAEGPSKALGIVSFVIVLELRRARVGTARAAS